jgi:hypothetical protein
MLRAVIWKELREQGLIGLTLVILGSGVLAAAAALADPPVPNAPTVDVIRYLGVGLLATLMLAVTAGMVCGGAVFAAEREAGTMPFLESLPTSRASLWGAKFAAGLGLALAQCGLLVAISASLGLIPTIGWAISITLCALLAFVWGVFGSTVAKTTLGSVGFAIPVAILTSIVVLFPVLLFFQTSNVTSLRPMGALVFLGCMIVIPVALSAWLFTGLDRRRAADGERTLGLAPLPTDGATPSRRRPRVGIAAMVWMTRRQLRIPCLVLSSFALVLGFSLLTSGVHPMLAWPALALAAGVLSGVLAFADEQTRGSSHYWGEQRLPVGRMWAVKISLHLLFCLWLLLLLALPLTIQWQFGEPHSLGRRHTILANVFRTALFDELGRHGWKYVFVPAVYGFAAGHLCGLLFRKPVVACGVAGIVGSVGALLWGPSLLSGGLSHWQVWLPPLLVLLMCRALIAAWTSDRLFDRRSLAILAGGGAASILALGIGIGYRVLEIPDRSDGEDDLAYVAGLPSMDDSVSRREFRSAADRYARVVASIGSSFDHPDTPTPLIGGRRFRVEERLEIALRTGWPAFDPELDSWMDRVFTSPPESDEPPWQAIAAGAASHPLEIFDYPQLVVLSTQRDPTLVNAYRMAVALLGRGLQQQAAGNSEAFLAALRTTLTLARTMQNGSILAALHAGFDVERAAMVALDRWLARLTPQARLIRAVLDPFPLVPAAALARPFEHPDLLRDAVQKLEAFDSDQPFDPTPHYLAERFVLREALKSPQHWLPLQLLPPGETPEVTPEIELVGVAWAVPWERERTRRLVGLGYEAGPLDAPLSANPRYITGRPGAAFMLRPRSAKELDDADRLRQGNLRAAILKLGLRAFKAEHGDYPKSLSELAASGYLRRVPVDPHDESRQYGYRVAPAGGETLRAQPSTSPPMLNEPPTTRFVPPGQAILWSVGQDKIDQGGTSLPVGGPSGFVRPLDLVYLVPGGGNP